MTPENERMEIFWKRNKFSRRERDAVERSPRYQAAIKANDMIKAEELACSFLIGDAAKRKFISDGILREEFGIDADLIKDDR